MPGTPRDCQRLEIETLEQMVLMSASGADSDVNLECVDDMPAELVVEAGEIVEEASGGEASESGIAPEFLQETLADVGLTERDLESVFDLGEEEEGAVAEAVEAGFEAFTLDGFEDLTEEEIITLLLDFDPPPELEGAVLLEDLFLPDDVSAPNESASSGPVGGFGPDGDSIDGEGPAEESADELPLEDPDAAVSIGFGTAEGSPAEGPGGEVIEVGPSPFEAFEAEDGTEPGQAAESSVTSEGGSGDAPDLEDVLILPNDVVEFDDSEAVEEGITDEVNVVSIGEVDGEIDEGFVIPFFEEEFTAEQDGEPIEEVGIGEEASTEELTEDSEEDSEEESEEESEESPEVNAESVDETVEDRLPLGDEIPPEFREIAESGPAEDDAGQVSEEASEEVTEGDAEGVVENLGQETELVTTGVGESVEDDVALPLEATVDGLLDLASQSGAAGPTTINGTDASDWIGGSEGDSVINAGGGDDEIHVPFGSNVIDGGEGDDTLFIYEADSSAFTVSLADNGAVIVEGPGLNGEPVRHELTNVERIVFNDRVVYPSEVAGVVQPPTEGTDAGEWISADSTIGNVVNAGGGDDFIHTPFGGTIDGGDGSDTLVVYEGVRADFFVNRLAGGTTVSVEGPGLNGTVVQNLLTNVEFILFNDELVATADITELLEVGLGGGSVAV